MSDFILWGTIVNVAAVLIGTAVGLLIRRFAGSAAAKSKRFSDTSDLIFKGLGLCVLLIGITGAIETKSILCVILSVTLGGLIGGLIDIDSLFGKLGNKLERLAGGKEGSISQGFVSASLLFCVGAMTVIGSMESGISCDHTTLISKSVIDMFAAVILASTMGVGVALSAATVFVSQGSITVIAYFAGNALADTVLTDAVVCEMSAVGSLIIIGLSLNMIGITKLKVANFLPAIFLPMGIMPLLDLITK